MRAVLSSDQKAPQFPRARGGAYGGHMASRDPSTAAAGSAPPGSAAEVPGDDAVSGDEEGKDHEVGDAEREPEQGAAAAGGGPD